MVCDGLGPPVLAVFGVNFAMDSQYGAVQALPSIARIGVAADGAGPWREECLLRVSGVGLAAHGKMDEDATKVELPD